VYSDIVDGKRYHSLAAHASNPPILSDSHHEAIPDNDEFKSTTSSYGIKGHAAYFQLT
jgi:hypothetical protein